MKERKMYKQKLIYTSLYGVITFGSRNDSQHLYQLITCTGTYDAIRRNRRGKGPPYNRFSREKRKDPARERQKKRGISFRKIYTSSFHQLPINFSTKFHTISFNIFSLLFYNNNKIHLYLHDLTIKVLYTKMFIYIYI